MDNRKKNILLGLLIVGIISMTIAFAALTTRLSLNGTANVAATSWNIHFDSWTSVTQSTVDNHQNTAEINESQITQTTAPNITKIDNVNVTLNQPGDYIKYNFVIVNDGSIDGKLSNFTKTVTPTNDVVGLTVNCYESSSREGTPLTTNYVLRAGETIYCYFEVKYNDVTNTSTAGSNQVYTQSAINASISANWTWIQDDTVSAATGNNVATGGGNNSLSNTYYIQVNGKQQTLDSSWKSYIVGNENTENKYAILFPDGREAGEYSGREACESILDEELISNGYTCVTKMDESSLELCAIINGTTKCFRKETIQNDWSCDENNQNCTVTGYIAQKKSELEQLGATCEIYNEGMGCTANDDVSCNFIRSLNAVGCGTSTNICYIPGVLSGSGIPYGCYPQ